MVIKGWLVAAVAALSACSLPETSPVSRTRHVADATYAADITPDATLSVVSSNTEGILVWDLQTQQQRFQLSHGDPSVNVVATVHVAADGSYMVSAERSTFALWNLTTGDPEGFWRIDESSVRDVAVANGGVGLLVGRGNGKVMYFEPGTGRRLEFLGHQEKINSVDLSPNGHYALTGGNDYTAYLWDTRSGQVIHPFHHSSRVTKVVLDDKGRYAFTADSKRDARIWNVQTGEPISTLRYLQRQKIFSSAVFSDDGKYLLTGSPSRRISLWEVSSGKEVAEWKVAPKNGSQPPSAVVYAVAFRGENQIMSESSSGFAEVWAIP
ncbi:hypothetical protein LJ739_12295 [Aestuariibacter halophilus]|uniref:Vegetatible incompatibility protein HET-E-1 n=1 Tax=Fluctibacter halophilus TaxID=226011 RepID=A0ABS8G8W2_9ALTE|nr:hypothetical protein [Aestuariibacter halophilus]MCC2617024.1 hypothetical protein [Aestuariibacter halophilus]